jgi:hypothetical protein
MRQERFGSPLKHCVTVFARRKTYVRRARSRDGPSGREIAGLRNRLCLFRSGQPGAFSQCAEFPLLRNRALGPLAVTVLPVPLARRGTTTACAAARENGFRQRGHRHPPAPRAPASANLRGLLARCSQRPCNHRCRIRGPALNAGSGGHANPGSIAARHR